ncbi:13131_t:CDS:2 [Funneliformis geosporum]|uniref:8148_t:CDS:1 n=1 Tax=Funneliformis geosporum TaxID=1117311 RepID=A0A9W4WKD2_9GLOM|nr:13131_t:CDS:2 [Funneliformis geosporum]CAI2168452.1 8148_t:CDS:2 [Funneliformis geosporum]
MSCGKSSTNVTVYNKDADFVSLAESYIQLSFEGRDEITPEYDDELDFEKWQEKHWETL